jgi:glycine cleavage system H protein
MPVLKYTKDHEWLRIEDDIATVGITDHAQMQLGELVFIEPPKVGALFGQGEVTAVVESVKAASEIYSPVAGEIIEFNTAIIEQPSLVNSDPTGAGWFFKMKIRESAQVEELLNEQDYKALIG